MTAVIINCDDMGLRHSINESIFDLIRRRCVTSASILTGRDGGAFTDAAGKARLLAKEGLDISIGLHLDLDAFFGFDAHGRYGSSEDDIVPGYGTILGLNKDAIAGEMERQAEALLEAGIRPSHLDGHHHVHLFPGILPLALALMKKYSIPAMRFDRSFYTTQSSLEEAQKLVRDHGIRTPGHFIDLGRIMSGGTGVLDGLEGTVEIMAHTDIEDNGMGRVDQYRFLLDGPFSRQTMLNFHRLEK